MYACNFFDIWKFYSGNKQALFFENLVSLPRLLSIYHLFLCSVIFVGWTYDLEALDILFSHYMCLFAYYVMFWFHFYRLDNLIFEAITSLKEPGGSNKTTIATYIEVVYFLFYLFLKKIGIWGIFFLRRCPMRQYILVSWLFDLTLT